MVSRSSGRPKDLADLSARATVEQGQAERRKVLEEAREPVAEVVGEFNDVGRAMLATMTSGASREETSPPSEWPEPERFETTARTVIPLDAFPHELAEWARAVAAAMLVPVEAVIMAALTIAGFALGGKVRVRVRAPGNPWHESTNLFTIIVGPSGSAKTGVFDLAVAPLAEAFDAAQDAMRGDRAEYVARLQIAESRAALAKKAAAGAGPAERAQREVEAVEAARAFVEIEGGAPREPYFLSRGGDGGTPEGITKALGTYKRVMLASDETGLFDTIAGRYAKDGKANFEVLLQAKDGSTMTVLRAGRDPQVIRNPRLGILIMGQPITAETMQGRTGNMKERGLLGRFAMCWPDWPKGTISEREEDDPIVSDVARAGYHLAINKLLAMPYPLEADTIPEVSLSREARAHFAPYYNVIGAEIQEGGAYASIASGASKNRGLVASLALIFHVMLTGQLGGQVSGEAMANAIRVGDALLGHALRFDGAPRAAETSKAAALWSYIVRLAEKAEMRSDGTPHPITVRDLQRAAKARFGQASEIRSALKDLAERRLVTAVESVTTERGGRPTERFHVNPKALR